MSVGAEKIDVEDPRELAGSGGMTDCLGVDMVQPSAFEDVLERRTAIDPDTGCWVWTGCLTATGYGWVMFHGNTTTAHRLAYKYLVGPIPDGMEIDHICRNRACANPDHLRAATQKQNRENLGGTRANNTSGYRGVYFENQSKIKPWKAVVMHNGKKRSVGRFASAAEAGAAARRVRLELFTHNEVDRL